MGDVSISVIDYSNPNTASELGGGKGSFFTAGRLLAAYVTDRNELDQHNLVAESGRLPVATHPEPVMRFDRVDVACAVRILGP